MPFRPLQPPAHLDTDGLRQHSEEQAREIERSWSELETDIEDALGTVGSDLTAGLATKVNKVGDTMTGQLTVNYSGGNQVHLANASYGVMHRNDNSNYYILFTNSGSPLGTFNGLRPFYINLATGNVTMGHAARVEGYFTVANAALITGELNVGSAATAGTLRFGATIGSPYYLTCDATNYSFGAGSVYANNFVAPSGTITAGPNGFYTNSFNGAGNPWQTSVLFTAPNVNLSLQGLHYSGVWYGWYMDLNGAATYSFRQDGSTHKSAGSGLWTVSSDARVKEEIGDYTAGLDVVASLRPVNFRYKGNHGVGPPTVQPIETEHDYKSAASELEFVGLLAQEAEIVMPECFTQGQGFIDGKEVHDLRSGEYTPLIFALVNCVKQLKTRIEVLEAEAKRADSV